ncbi:hypothetical protein D3C81_914780 [compost metagenome]
MLNDDSSGKSSPAAISCAKWPRVARATARPVSTSKPGDGLISIFIQMRCALQYATTASKVGTPSPANCGPNQAPASIRPSSSAV